MGGKREKPEDIVLKLRQVEVLQGQGKPLADSVRQIGVTVQTYYRWCKEFGGMRKWVVNNLDNDPVKIFRKIYYSMYANLQPETIPHAVLIIADYQYKSAFVADQEINLVACLTELMSQVKFK